MRFLLRAFLVLFAALAGFAAAAALGSVFLISRHAGLAGAAEAVAYGAAGALIASVAAGFVVVRLGGRTLLRLALVAALLLVLLFAWAYWNQQASDGASPPSPAQPRPVTEPAPGVAP